VKKVIAAAFLGGILAASPLPGFGASVYVHVDEEGIAHFTDAPTKSYFRLLPAFGLPKDVDLTHGQYADLINALAVEHGVDPVLVKAIIRTESNFDQHAVSRKGARGLMQLMPGTAHRFTVSNPFDPAENIRGGVAYLKYLQELFPGQLSLVIAAYNAGENAVLRHNAVPPYPETREYVKRVLRYYGRRADRLFVSARPPGSSSSRAARPASSVFRTEAADGTPVYSNLPPLVRPGR